MADEFRRHVMKIRTDVAEQRSERSKDTKMVRGLLQRQDEVLASIKTLLERIEGLVATLPTEAGAREFVEALGAAAPPDDSAQPDHGEDAPATAFRPAAEEQ